MSETRASQPQGSLPIEATDPNGATILGGSPNSSGLPSPPIGPEPLTRSPMSHPQGAFAEATQALGLTPQEQYLYQHHLHNLMGPGHITQSGGEVSTLLQANVQGPDGRYYNIPTVWYGQQLPMPLARLMAAQAGWDKWPAYADSGEAERRYYDMHQYITRDLALIGR